MPTLKDIATREHKVLLYFKEVGDQGATCAEISNALKLCKTQMNRDIIALYQRGILSRKRKPTSGKTNLGYRYFYLENGKWSEELILEQLENKRLLIPILCKYEIRYFVFDLLMENPQKQFTNRDLFLKLGFDLPTLRTTMKSIRSSKYVFHRESSSSFLYKWDPSLSTETHWRELSSVRMEIMSLDNEFEINDLLKVKHPDVSPQDVIYLLVSGVQTKRLSYRQDENTGTIYYKRAPRTGAPTIK